MEYIFKTISALTAVIYFLEQVALAGDLGVANKLDPDHGSNIISAESITARLANQAKVDSRNAAEDLIRNNKSAEAADSGETTNLMMALTIPDKDTHYGSGRLKTREVFDEPAEGEYKGKHVIYTYIDEDAGDGEGRVSQVDVIDDEYELGFMANGNKVSLGNNTTHKLSEFTVSMDVKIDEGSSGVWVPFLTKRSGSAVTRFEIWKTNNGRLSVTIPGGIEGETFNGTDYSLNTVGVWRNITVTYTAGELKAYLDGVEIITKSAVSDGMYFDAEMFLGYRAVDSATLAGDIKDVKLYNRALSSGEVNAVSNDNDVTGGKVSDWAMDEGTGTVINDAIGRNDGTITGPTWSLSALPGPESERHAIVYADPNDPENDKILIKTIARLSDGKPIYKEAFYSGSGKIMKREYYRDLTPDLAGVVIAMVGEDIQGKNIIIHYDDNPAGTGDGNIKRIEVEDPITLLKFDGYMDGVSLGVDPSHDLKTFTISLDVNIGDGASGKWVPILTKRGTSVDERFEIWKNGVGQVYISFPGSNGGLDKKEIGYSLAGVNRWYNIALGYDGNTIKVYVDGIEVITQSWDSLGMDFSAEMFLGYRKFDNSSLPGSIRDVRLFDRMITTGEVMAINSGVDITAGLVSAWDMNEGSGWSVTDRVGTNNGSVIGPVWENTDDITEKSVTYEFEYYGETAEGASKLFSKTKKDHPAGDLVYKETYYEDSGNLSRKEFSKNIPDGITAQAEDLAGEPNIGNTIIFHYDDNTAGNGPGRVVKVDEIKRESVLALDGTGDGVTVQSSALHSLGAFTISMDVKFSSGSQGNWVPVFTKRLSNSDRLEIWKSGAGRVYISMPGGEFGDDVSGSVGSLDQLDKWYSLEMRYDGATVTVYVDGSEVISKTYPAGACKGLDFDGDMFFGYRQVGTASLAGAIKNVKLSSGAGASASLVSAWDMDEGTGTGIIDRVNGINGTVIGASWEDTGKISDKSTTFELGYGENGSGDVIITRAEKNYKTGEISGFNEYDSVTGTLTRSLDASGNYREYSRDPNGALISYRDLCKDGHIEVFDPSGKSIYVWDPAVDGIVPPVSEGLVSITNDNGDIIRYKNGDLDSVILKENGSRLSGIVLSGEGKLDRALVSYPDGGIGVVYNGELMELIARDGTIKISRGNDISAEYSPRTGLNLYSLYRDARGELKRTRITGEEWTSIYDASGIPVSFSGPNGEYTEFENGHILRVNRNGVEYRYAYDPAGNRSTLTGVTTDDAVPVSVIYGPGGEITVVTNSAGETINISEGNITVTDSNTLSAIITLDPSDQESRAKFEIDRDDIARIYNENGALIKLITSDDTVVNFGTSGDITSIKDPKDVEYIYSGTKLSEIRDGEGVAYVLDDDNKIISARYPDGRLYTYKYVKDANGTETVVVTDTIAKIERHYRDDNIIYQVNELGLETDYEYTTIGGEQKISVITQKRGDKGMNVFTYTYGAKITLADNTGTVREFDTNNKLTHFYDGKGRAYRYLYNADGSMIAELAEEHHDDGRVVYYKEGAVDYVTCPNGVVLEDIGMIEDNNGLPRLKKFTVVMADGAQRASVIDGDWVNVTANDGTRLFYKSGSLAGIYANYKLVKFMDIAIPGEDDLYRTGEQEKIGERLTGGGNQWRDPDPGSGDNYRGSAETMHINADLLSRDWREAYVDLRYPEPNSFDQGTRDLSGKKASFYIKLDEGTLPPGKSVTAQIFAKSEDSGVWGDLYGTEVTITNDNGWYKVELVVSDDKPLFGIKSANFDPKQVRLIGVRLRDDYDRTFNYNGGISIVDANYGTCPGGSYVSAPFLVPEDSVKPYVGIIWDGSSVGNPNFRMWDNVPARQEPGEVVNKPLVLEDGSWRAQNIEYSQGIKAVTLDNTLDAWALNADMAAGSETNNDGEVYIDLRYDLAGSGYVYEGPLDLLDKELKFRVKAPAGFIGDGIHSSWAQVFVKDENYNYEYGNYVNITREGEWFEVTLKPGYGEIPGGVTSEGFDPTRIVNIGLKFSCGADSGISFKDKIYFRNETNPNVFNSKPAKRLVDMSTLADYAKRNNYNLGFEEALASEVTLAKEHLPNYFKDTSWVMKSVYDKFGRLEYVYKGDNRVEHYDARGLLVEVTDTDWNPVVRYSYDEDQNIVDIDYDGMRRSTRFELEKTKLDIESRKDQALLDLAKAKDSAIYYLNDQKVQIINECDNALNQLYAQLQAINSWNPFWPSDKKKKNSMRNEIEVQIQNVKDSKNEAVRYINDEYMKVPGDISNAHGMIMSEYSTTIAAVRAQEETAERNILEQEVRQIINIYYLKILGRNPGETSANGGTDEMSYWITMAKSAGCANPVLRVAFLDVIDLESELKSLPEYTDKVAFNNSVITDVETVLNSYTDPDAAQAGRAAILTALGLTETEVTAHNNTGWGSKDAAMIIDWLKTNQINLGRCAFETVLKLMENNGAVFATPAERTQAMKNIARDILLIEVFMGSIDTFTEGTLSISLFAMDRYLDNWLRGERREDRGQSAEFKAAKTDIAGLKWLVKDEGRDIIVHLSSNHYVIVTDIAENGDVTYYEPNKNTAGESITLDEKTFLMNWTGYVLADRAPPANPNQAPNSFRELTTNESLLVKGNFLFALPAIFYWLSAISVALSFIDNSICQLVSKILGIVTLVFSAASIIANLPNIIGGFFSGLQTVTQGVGGVFTALGKLVEGGTHAIMTFFGDFGKTLLDGIKMFTYNYAITNAMDTLGVNNDISRITASFMTGGYSGGSDFLTGALTSTIKTGVSLVGRETGLDPFLSDMMSTGAACMGGAFLTGMSGPDGSLSKAYDLLSQEIGSTIVPYAAEEISYYGILRMGETIGLPAELSNLAGIAVRDMLNVGFSDGQDPENMWQAVQDGLVQGVAKIGIDYAIDQLDINPMLANIGFSAISTAINGTLRGMFSGDEDFDIFKFMYESYRSNAIAFFGGNISSDEPAYTIGRIAYMDSVMTFSDVVKERGIVEALNAYATGFFNTTAVNAIASSGKTIGRYFYDKWQAGQKEQVTLKDDTTVDGIRAENTDSILLFDSEGNIIGLKEGETLLFGEIGVDGNGKMALLNGYLDGSYIPGLGITLDINGGVQSGARIIDTITGETLCWVRPNEEGGSLYYDSYRNYLDAEIDDVLNGNTYTAIGPDGNYSYRMSMGSVIDEDDDGLLAFADGESSNLTSSYIDVQAGAEGSCASGKIRVVLSGKDIDGMIDKTDPAVQGIPLWKIGASIAAGFMPVVGELHDGIQVMFGKDIITGETLTPLERAVSGTCLMMPCVGSALVRHGGKSLLTKSDDILDFMKGVHETKVVNYAEKALVHSDELSDASTVAWKLDQLGIANDLPGGVVYDGRIVRGVPKQYKNDIWRVTTYDKFSGVNRYAPFGIGTISAGANSTTTLRELAHLDRDFMETAFGVKNVMVNNMLDLTDPMILTKLGIKNSDLIQENTTITRLIGDFAYYGGYNGIIAPSARFEGVDDIPGLVIHLFEKGAEEIT
ncbi:MAG: hypothetical protein HQL30_03235 [Candidatus Omnitrophica bacterium]|nr:hypothetical protein [Candidatus Omnitrophota bacterium]